MSNFKTMVSANSQQPTANSLLLKPSFNHLFRKTILTILVLFSIVEMKAQTFVNQEWEKITGSPSGLFKYSVSTVDINDNLIIAGNTVNGTQKENFLITKYDNNGTQIWQTNYDKSVVS
jgi:hypothetical protein